jgi:hypothetical protein
MTDGMKTLIDIVERAIATWLEVFLGLLVTSTLFNDLSVGHWAAALSAGQRAAIAAVPAGLAVIKGAISSFVGRKGSAAALPARAD